MSTNSQPHRRPFSKSDKVILALQAIAVVVVGSLAFISANDPDWGDLQRLVVLMMLGIWVGSLVTAALLARLVSNRWWRYALLLAGPFVGMVVLIVAVNS